MQRPPTIKLYSHVFALTQVLTSQVNPLTYLSALYLALIATSLLGFLLVDGPGLTDARLILAGAALLLAARLMSGDELAFLRKAIQVPLALVVVSAVWIIIQILPLPILANPIWDSARAALGTPLAGHISVDLPTTEVALAATTLSGATMILGAAVSLERAQAAQSLAALTLCATILTAGRALGLGIMVQQGEGLYRASAFDTAAIALILSLGRALLVFERFETRRHRQPNAAKRFVVHESLCLLAVATATVVLWQAQARTVAFATLCGAGVFLAIVLSRRLNLGLVGRFGLAVAMLALLIWGAGFQPTIDSLLFAYASAPQSLIEHARRMVHDAPLVGTGAGTFGIFDGLYRGIDDPPVAMGPSLIADWVVELGPPMVCAIGAGVLVTLVLLLRGGLSRGRDSAYAIMGSALMVTLAILAFVDAGLSDASLEMLTSGALGLALGQRLSRRAEQS